MSRTVYPSPVAAVCGTLDVAQDALRENIDALIGRWSTQGTGVIETGDADTTVRSSQKNMAEPTMRPPDPKSLSKLRQGCSSCQD